jgi:hypothetical protein
MWSSHFCVSFKNFSSQIFSSDFAYPNHMLRTSSLWFVYFKLCYRKRTNRLVLLLVDVWFIHKGRAIAQAISRWLPTAGARVRARVWSSGICGGQCGDGAGFLLVLRFSLPIFIPPNSTSSRSPAVGTIGQKWPMCRVDPVWTPPLLREFKKKLKWFLHPALSSFLAVLWFQIHVT